MYTKLKKIEKVYRKKVQAALKNDPRLTAERWIDISIAQFNELKVKGISDSEAKENDMLLYQYGIYNWGDAFGSHFSFDITRQFIAPGQDEPYQLIMTLIYEPELFQGIGAYNCWSDSYVDINAFVLAMKATDGFKAAMKHIPRSYQVRFEEC